VVQDQRFDEPVRIALGRSRNSIFKVERVAQAADILIEKIRDGGTAVLVAHGYFNAMIGRQLRQRGFTRTGAHRVRYWNAVTYEWNQP